MGNTAHPNQGGDLSLYRSDGLEYKLYMPNMGLHAQYGPSVYIHNIQAYTCLILARNRSVRRANAKTGPEILKQLNR